MNIKKGDYVTRKSYNHDTLFKVINIENGIYYLKGVEVRLLADSLLDDLKKVEDYIEDRQIYITSLQIFSRLYINHKNRYIRW